MCGIVGIRATARIDANRIQVATDTLRHRGPDAQQCYSNEEGTVHLGHTRLSIIDLSTSANQPFISANKRYVVVFNGEIYNFLDLRKEIQTIRSVEFRTSSDTEVVLEAFLTWGVDMVRRLNGMFAICLYDRHTDNLYLFRDPLGKKPIFYYQSATLFAFASEIKSIVADRAIDEALHINNVAVSRFLHLGYVPEPDTIYDKLFKFPAGAYGIVDRDLNMVITRYWSASNVVNGGVHVQHPKNVLKGLLEASVKRRLISDVPVGTFLSGGTDSSLISALAASQFATPLSTFTIGFKESKFDESAHARAVAQHLGSDHHEYFLTETDALELLDTYLDNFDEPFSDTSAIPTMLVSRLARKHVKVILTGDGGDELFHGYGAYAWANRLKRFPLRYTRTVTSRLLDLSGKSRLKRISQLIRPEKGSERSHIFSQEQYFFSQREIGEALFKSPGDYSMFEYRDPELSFLSEADKQSLFDLQYYLKDDLLVKVDRASMYYGLECRSPLLDQDVVAFALSLPSSLKIRNGVSKFLLKEILLEYLPQELVHKPKWGFSVPLAKWLQTDLRYLITQFLDERTTESVGLFNYAYVKKLVQRFFGGQEFLYQRIWVMIVIHRWIIKTGKSISSH